MASRNKSKSSGLRILWLPGGRKNHAKGRFDATNKSVSGYGPKQKKSEVWSLGGRRAQTNLLFAEPDTRLLDGPTTSARLVPPIAGAVGVVSTIGVEQDKVVEINTKNEVKEEPSPSTSLSTTITTASPIPVNTSTPISTEASTPTMPGKTINTTNAEIMDDNRFSILGKEILHQDFDVNDLPSVPREDPIVLQQNQQILLNTSSDTTKTVATTTPSSPKSDTGNSNKDDSTQSNKKLNHRNHNNNNNKQIDINSIESISDNNIPKALNSDLTWIDDLYRGRNNNKSQDAQERNKRKKKKKHANAKKMDQLDGVPIKQTTTSEPSTDEDEKVVKCLYYTLMCCDCSIS